MFLIFRDFGINDSEIISTFWVWLVQAHGGTMSGLTKKLAGLGAGGRYPGNIERDLYRVLNLPIAPYYVELPTRCQNNRESIVLSRIPMLLPHELYHYLFEPWRLISLMFTKFVLAPWKVITFTLVFWTKPPLFPTGLRTIPSGSCWLRIQTSWSSTRPRLPSFGIRQLRVGGWIHHTRVNGAPMWLDCTVMMLVTHVRVKNLYPYLGTVSWKNQSDPWRPWSNN